MWLPRLSIFSQDNPYYSPNGDFNIYVGDNRMPNCTAYAYLRMQEAMELSKRDSYLIRGSGGFGNAKTWFNTTPLKKGFEPKEGSICVFDGNCGHVAFVEVVNDNTAIISQSQYDKDKSLRNYKYWETREAELIVGKATLSGVGALIGFIYPEINDIRVNRDTTKEQVEILEDMVNVRIEPEGQIFCKGLYAPKGIYNVLEKRFVNGYNWFKLEPNHWVREGNWLKHYDIDNTYATLYWQEVEKRKQLEERLRQINSLSEV